MKRKLQFSKLILLILCFSTNYIITCQNNRAILNQFFQRIIQLIWNVFLAICVI